MSSDSAAELAARADLLREAVKRSQELFTTLTLGNKATTVLGGWRLGPPLALTGPQLGQRLLTRPCAHTVATRPQPLSPALQPALGCCMPLLLPGTSAHVLRAHLLPAPLCR